MNLCYTVYCNRVSVFRYRLFIFGRKHFQTEQSCVLIVLYVVICTSLFLYMYKNKETCHIVLHTSLVQYKFVFNVTPNTLLGASVIKFCTKSQCNNV